MTLPVALSADVAVNLVSNTADQSPLAATRSFPGNPSVPSDLGATGASPHDTQLSPQILHDAGNQQALATGAGPRDNLPNGPLGIPGVVLDAYLHAQQVMGAEDPGCHLPWWLLAGIGKIESSQAENGEVDANGTTLQPILGPELNGQNGFAAIPAILGGRWTGDPVWQRAVGPMQFLPSTWLTWGRGGNPNNVYDSALAAGRYLCAGGGNLSQPADEAAAVFSYNHSDSYVRIVLIWANAYRQGVTPLPEVVAAPEGPAPSNRPLPSRTPGAGGTAPGGGPAAPGSSAPAGPAPA
ncbi:MAG TPA: lytic transglycosylase, partial [Pseudonocardiaceae bacterium]|nr:lytic transglycosylase [Pseudonocardiaceae bacterium]